MKNTAIATLTASFEESGNVAEWDAKQQGGEVVLSWPSVPIEIIRAAGLSPVFVRGGFSATPMADAYLEPGIFPDRLRRLAQAALSERLAHAAAIVIPRTSDPDYKFFLYLREFVRRGIVSRLPPVLLLDVLQSQGPDVRSYNAARLRDLLHELTKANNRIVTLDDLRLEIDKSNSARAAGRRLNSLRRGIPRIKGAEVFPLLGAFWTVEPETYAILASAAADEIARRSPLAGPRVLLAGAPVDGTKLHLAIEMRGAVVVSEIGPWGSGAIGADVACDDDPITALADKYSADILTPRTPAPKLRTAIAELLDDVDAVVVSLPREDTTFGWDYPSLRSLLQSKGIPHVCLSGDSHTSLSAANDERLDTLMSVVPVRMEERRG